MLRALVPLIVALSLPSCAASVAPVAGAPAQDASAPAGQQGRTLILDRAAADRLLGADGITLQWIGWERRGPVMVREDDGTIKVTGSQAAPDGLGRLSVEGEVREIGADYFILEGVVMIADAPEVGRTCRADKLWRFAITQDRKYWRLREFEWCDGLTDYVDIYF